MTSRFAVAVATPHEIGNMDRLYTTLTDLCTYKQQSAGYHSGDNFPGQQGLRVAEHGECIMSGDDLVQQLDGIIRPIDCADDWSQSSKMEGWGQAH